MTINRTSIHTKTKARKLWKRLALTALAVVLLAVVFWGLISCRTQWAIGAFQKIFYQDSPINSFSPVAEPCEGWTDSGHYMRTSVQYGDTYPNSYLHIQYPDHDTAALRPTLFYIHGGGYFQGSAIMGDPMAASNVTGLYDALCADGFNVVAIDYCLVPDYHFPDPLRQMNEALAFLCANADQYHLDMTRVVIMGSSAGAIMTAQYGAILTNPEYAMKFGIEPAISPAAVHALVIDDAPLDYSEFDWVTKVILGNYLSGNIWPAEDVIDCYEPFGYLTANYPDSFLVGSSFYGPDMRKLYDALTSMGVSSALCYPSENSSLKTAHCFMTEVRSDSAADAAYQQMMQFLKDRLP